MENEISTKKSSKPHIKLSIILSYVYLLVAIIGSYVITPKLLEYIGDDKYGLLAFCNSITTWLATISTALGSSYIFFAKKENLDCSLARTTNTIYFKIFSLLAGVFETLIIGISLSLFFFNVPFSSYSLSDSKIIYLLFIISGSNVCITIFLSVFNVYLISDKQFVFLRAKLIFISLLTHGVNLLLAFLTKSIVFVAVSTLATTLLSRLLNMVFSLCARKMKFNNASFKNNKPLLKNLFVYSSFVLINVLISTMNNNMDKTLLGIIVDSKSVTYYTLAYSFTLYLTMMIGSISESFMPKIHELYNAKRFDDANALFLRISKIQSLIMTLVVFGFIACGYEFCLLWIKEERAMVYYYAVVLNLISLVPLTSTTCVDCERALDKHKFRAIVYAIAALLNLVISIALLLTINKSYAIWCCIIGTAVSKVLSEYIILPIYDKKVIKLGIGRYYLDLGEFVLFSLIALVFPLIYHYTLSSSINTIVSLVIEGLSFAVVFGLLVLIFERKFVFSFITKRKKV